MLLLLVRQTAMGPPPLPPPAKRPRTHVLRLRSRQRTASRRPAGRCREAVPAAVHVSRPSVAMRRQRVSPLFLSFGFRGLVQGISVLVGLVGPRKPSYSRRKTKSSSSRQTLGTTAANRALYGAASTLQRRGRGGASAEVQTANVALAGADYGADQRWRRCVLAPVSWPPLPRFAVSCPSFSSPQLPARIVESGLLCSACRADRRPLLLRRSLCIASSATPPRPAPDRPASFRHPPPPRSTR